MIVANILPFIMIIVSLFFTLIIGLYFSKKITSFQENELDNKNFATCTKKTLLQLSPDISDIAFAGLYIFISSIVSIVSNNWNNELDIIVWHAIQILIGVLLVVGATIVHESKNTINSSWRLGLACLLTLIFCLPVDAVWHWVHVPSAKFALALSFVHCGLLLMFLPLLLSLVIVVTILLVFVYPIASVAQPSILLGIEDWYTVGIGILGFFMIHYCKKEQGIYQKKILKMEQRQQARREKQNQELTQMETDLHKLHKEERLKLDIMIKVINDVKKVFFQGKNSKFSYKEAVAILNKIIQLYNRKQHKTFVMVYKTISMEAERWKRMSYNPNDAMLGMENKLELVMNHAILMAREDDKEEF
jgi:hypothetical protein